MSRRRRLLFLSGGSSYDPDALAYINAVEAADGEKLQSTVKDAINNLFLSLKDEDIFQKISVASLLAGPRTLSGALVPMIGSQVVNVNFSIGDHSQSTGLKGGVGKYILHDNFDPLTLSCDNVHVSGYITEMDDSTTGIVHPIVSNDITTGVQIHVGRSTFSTPYVSFSRNLSNTLFDMVGCDIGFYGTSRSTLTGYTDRFNGVDVARTMSAGTIPTSKFVGLRRTTSQYSRDRIAFYSIGQAVNLEKLEEIITTYMAEISSIIPPYDPDSGW